MWAEKCGPKRASQKKGEPKKDWAENKSGPKRDQPFGIRASYDNKLTYFTST